MKRIVCFLSVVDSELTTDLVVGGDELLAERLVRPLGPHALLVEDGDDTHPRFNQLEHRGVVLG